MPRSQALWEVVEGGDYTGSKSGSNARQCPSVGATIQVQPFGGGGLQSWSGCSEKHVVPKDGDRYNVMKARTNFATNYWKNMLTIKPVRGPIVIDSAVRSQYNLQTVNVTDADLVLIMLARPSPFAPVAGYAGCVQSDQYGRCVVGIFNWVPEVLDVDNANSPDTIATERHTGTSHRRQRRNSHVSDRLGQYSTHYLVDCLYCTIFQHCTKLSMSSVV